MSKPKADRTQPRTLAVASTAAAFAALACSADGAQAANCENLAGKAYGDATISEATDVAPPFSVTGKDPPTPVSVDAPFCRVQGTIKPSADSDIKFEVWLPPEASWNGKVQGVGNGGFAGSLIYIPMTWALDAGYAVSGTDTGHSGGTLDSDWALGHPEKIIDFGWRAIHLTAEASKAIVADYYGKAPEHAYFSGCSDGGREALMEAQRFPNDYDGIVAGAPASNWTKLLTNAVWSEQAVDQPNSWLSPEKLSIVTKAVLADCHGEDGYVGDPAECHFHASNLVCKAGQSEGCLSEPEDAALTKIYSGAEDANGKSIFPGYAPGGEAGQAAWALWITGTDPKRTAGTLMNGFGTGYFANMVFDKPDWRIDGQNVSDDLAVAEKTTSQTLDATDPDLTAFKAAGGKLIQYHGWNDAAIPPQSSIDYYESVASTMGGIQNLKSFYRLFMAPGMEHCGGGPGPNAVGGVFGLLSPSRDPAHDVVAALGHWVEHGAAPDFIIATRYLDNDPANGLEAQRPWCPYPAAARFLGQGERGTAESYACAAPAQ
ncbi:MAG TPA: tannase/feruloyl esterase family alpha/beta hydrolase [Roseiarcus sp.]|nr:tannase/feruloyl esterase family alpha/beta hydrolase [Roseiarcus sp.]